LTYGIKTDQPKQLIQQIKELLDMPDLKAEWAKRRTHMLSKSIDFSRFMTALIEK